MKQQQYRQTRMLRLPGGGSLELPMPNDTRVFVNAPPVLSGAPPDEPSVLWPVLIGSALGGGLTWLLLRLTR